MSVVNHIKDNFLLFLIDYGYFIDELRHLRDDALFVDKGEDRNIAQGSEHVVDVCAPGPIKLPKLGPVFPYVSILEIVYLIELVCLHEIRKDLTFPAPLFPTAALASTLCLFLFFRSAARRQASAHFSQSSLFLAPPFLDLVHQKGLLQGHTHIEGGA